MCISCDRLYKLQHSEQQCDVIVTCLSVQCLVLIMLINTVSLMTNQPFTVYITYFILLDVVTFLHQLWLTLRQRTSHRFNIFHMMYVLCLLVTFQAKSYSHDCLLMILTVHMFWHSSRILPHSRKLEDSFSFLYNIPSDCQQNHLNVVD